MRSLREADSALRLLNEQVLASSLLPPRYAHFLPVMADALVFFIGHLSGRRQRQLLGEQLLSPGAYSLAERLSLVLRHSPVLHKLGQVIARDHRLSPEFRLQLQKLESVAPSSLSVSSKGWVESQLQRGWRSKLRLGREVLAEGSVAWVVPFSWSGKEQGSARRGSGVLKILKPGIEYLLEQDLEILDLLGAYLDDKCAEYRVPALAYQETFATIRELLRHEIHLEQEQQHLAEAGRLLASNPRVSIPALLPFCTRRITAMQRIDGCKLTDLPTTNPALRRDLARLTAETLVAEPMLSPESAALFHADPHAGNLLCTPDARLGILDWSLVGRLTATHRAALCRLILGAAFVEPGLMRSAVGDLAQCLVNPEAATRVIHEHLRALRRRRSLGATWLTDFLDDLAVQAQVRWDRPMLLFRKALLTLEGVLTDLTGEGSVRTTRVLDDAWRGRLLAGFLSTWSSSAPVFSLNAAALSAYDLVRLAWSAPLAGFRWWSEFGLDISEAMRGAWH